LNEATRLDGSGLDLDSLERLTASAAVNEYFRLHETGAEDYLLSLATVGEWCDLVLQSRAANGTHLTFRTSGSTGTPKPCTHAVVDLTVEVDAWARLLGPVERVVSLVPAHHIYGTIFTALLPDRLSIECLSMRSGGLASVSRAIPGTLVVGTPTMWAYLARSLPVFPRGLMGISSTAPLPATLARELHSRGLERLIEIYGSSETGGIAYREDPASAFALLDHWRHDGDDILSRDTIDGGRATHRTMDDVTWWDERRFTIGGRRDGAVQVGGHNVYPERIRRRLLEHRHVAEAAVRLDAVTGRLKAFVVPTAAAVDRCSTEELDTWCAVLRDVERPRPITIGAAVPRTSMGKLADW
jgi:4-coumarate--CoA ligase